MSARRGAAVDPYVCLPKRTLDDLRAAGFEFPPSPAALYIELPLLSMALRIPGVIVTGPAGAAEAIGWDVAACVESLDSLESAGLVVTDRRARIVYMPGLLAAECSRPSSPSTAAMWKRELLTLAACDLRERIIRDARQIIAGLDHAETHLLSFDSGRDPQKGKPKNQHGDLAGSPDRSPDRRPSRARSGTGTSLEQERERESQKTLAAPAASSSFDFERVYAAYPRHEGRKQGLTKLRATVKTPERFEQLERALQHFIAKVKADHTEPRFIPMFSTWATRWEDYIAPPQLVAPPAPRGPRGVAPVSDWTGVKSGEQ